MKLFSESSMSQQQGLVIRPAYVPFVGKGSVIIAASVILYAVSDFVSVSGVQIEGTTLNALIHYGLFILIAVGGISMLAGLIQRNAYMYTITDSDIIIRKHLLRRSIRRIPLTSISDVQVTQSLFGSLLGYGDVVPVTKSGYGLVRDMEYAAEVTVAEMTDVPDPERISDLIMSKIEGMKPTG